MKCVPDIRMFASLCQMLQTFTGSCSFVCVMQDNSCVPVRTVGDVFVEQTCSLQGGQCTFPCREEESSHLTSWVWDAPPTPPSSIHAPPPSPSWWDVASPPPSSCSIDNAPGFLQAVYMSQCPTATSCEECTHTFQYCKWGDITDEQHCAMSQPLPPPHVPPFTLSPAPPSPGCQVEDAPPILHSQYEQQCPSFMTCTACVNDAQFCAWHGARSCD